MDTNLETDDQETVDVEQIMRDLDVEFDHLPEAAIRAAQRHREAITPLLIESIRRATERALADDAPTTMGHLLAMFLLTEFRAKEALPTIVESFLLTGESLEFLYGYDVIEYLPSVLAELARDDLPAIEAIIANRQADEFVRTSAYRSFLLLVRDEVLTRDRAIEILRRHLVEAIEQRDPIVSWLLCELTDYAPIEAKEEIERAFELKLVDESIIDQNFIEGCYERGDALFQESLSRAFQTGIRDTFDELKYWACFDVEYQREYHEEDWASDDDFDNLEDNRLDGLLLDDDFDLSRTYGNDVTIVNESRKIGRNEPCPCGSGKKYKKCCGKN